MWRLLHRLPVLALDAPTAGQPVDAVSLEIGASEYGKYARHGTRSARVGALDFRMCMRRAHENASDHCRQLDIGDVIAPPGQEAKILLSARGSANPDHFGHGSVSPDGAACTLWYRVRQQMLPSGQGIVNCPKHRWSLSDRFSGAVPPPRSILRAYDSRHEPCRPQRAGDTAIASTSKVRPHAQVSRTSKVVLAEALRD